MVPIDHFDVSADQRPEQPAIIDEDRAITYAELVAMSWKVGGFVAATSRSDAPVQAVIFSPNHYGVLVAMLGVMRAGGAIVPLHAGNDLATNTAVLAQLQPQCLFYHSSLIRQVERLREAFPSIERYICLDAPLSAAESLEAILEQQPLPIPDWLDPAGNRSRPMFYWATSGTTGGPKVVVEDCGCFDIMLRASRQRRDPLRQVGTTMSLGPMTHGGGPSAIATMTLGGTVLIQRHFDATNILERIAKYGITELWLSPTALVLLLEHPEVRSYDCSSLRSVLLGAAGIAADKLRQAVDVFGPCIAHSYGQIEASFITLFDGPALAAAVNGQHPERLYSSGRTMNVSRLAIMSEEGQILPSGSEGEIVVRGACVKRYLDPELEQHAKRLEWHHTGDVGYIDADGFLYITNRIKDVINVSGFKVAAREVECVIEELCEIEEVAVVPCSDDMRGEVVRAVVTVRRGHAFDAARIVSHCRIRLGQRKTPAMVEHWQELPRSPAGKIDKRKIAGSHGNACLSLKAPIAAG